MQDQSTPIAPPGATKTRFRGRLYLAQLGSGEAISAVIVCVDFATACLALAGSPEGDVWLVGPNEGAPLRKYLAGSPPPLACAMRAEPKGIVAEVVRATGVSKATARVAVEAVLRDHGGVGRDLYEARNLLQGGGSK